MTARVIDGKAFAARVRGQVAEHVTRLKAAGVVPGLAVVLVGETRRARSMSGPKASRPSKPEWPVSNTSCQRRHRKRTYWR